MSHFKSFRSVAIPAGFALILIASSLLSASASAAIITYQITGSANSVNDIGNYFPGITVGTPFTGSFTYDTSLTGSPSPYSNMNQTYFVPAPIYPNSVSINAGGYSFQPSNSASAEFSVSYDKDWSADILWFRYDGIANYPVLTTDSFTFLGIGFNDSTKTALDSGALPNSITLAPWTNTLARVYFAGNGSRSNTIGFDFSIDTITAVPEPGTLALLGLGLAGLGFIRRRKL